MKHASLRGFTLLELSIVLAIIGIVTGSGIVMLGASLQSTQMNQTVARMNAIDQALLDFGTSFSRLPCPSDLTIAAGAANYGVEAATPGVCTGGTPAATNTWSNNAVEGGVPTRALRLPDSYMYDAWGHRFRYAVDPTYTAAGSLPVSTGTCAGSSASGLTVNDASGSTRTTDGVYALISHGQNGHGAYTRTGGTTMLNAGSNNANEQANCHCSQTAAASGTSPIYVQQAPTVTTTGNATTAFDDIVSYREPWQIQSQSVPLGATAQCVYELDQCNSRVEMFSLKTGSYIKQFPCASGACSGTPYYDPHFIGVDPNGNVWIGYNYGGAVKYTGSGIYTNVAASIPGINQNVYTFAFDPTGNLWMATSYTNYSDDPWVSANAVFEFNTTTGALMGTLCNNTYSTSPTAWQNCSTGTAQGYFDGLNSVAFDSNGNLWTEEVDNGDGNIRWQEFTSGSYSYMNSFPITGIPTGGLSYSILDNFNNIWISSYYYGIAEFNSSGTYMTAYGEQFSPSQIRNPQSYVFDPSNNLWVTDFNSSSIIVLNHAGTYLATYGNGAGSGPGQIPSGCSAFLAIGSAASASAGR